MEIIRLNGRSVELSESASNPDVYIAKFIICDFNKNLNNVILNRDTIDDWLSTLKNKPVVGKISVRSDGKSDFTGHNAKVVIKKDENGNEYEDLEFDTSAFGTFIGVAIETIDEVEYIVATAEIWKRFVRACEIIKTRIENGGLATSWEISVVESHQMLSSGTIVKSIDMGRFLGHCLLGENVEPAYPSSGLLEVASISEDSELLSALSQDLIDTSSDINTARKEELNMKKNNKTVIAEDEKIINTSEVVETETDTQPEKCNPCGEDVKETNEDNTSVCKKKKADEKIEKSTLTESDIYDKLSDACRKALDKWCYVAFVFPEKHKAWIKCECLDDLCFIEFTYIVNEDDTVSIGDAVDINIGGCVSSIAETMAKLNTLSEALVTANAEIKRLEPFRDEYEKAEADKKLIEHKNAVSELSEYVKASKCFTSDEISEMNELIESLDKTTISQRIADRVVENMTKNKEDINKEFSSISSEASVNLSSIEDEPVDFGAIMKKFLNK